MQFTQVLPQKIFLASMEVTEAGEAAEAENFPKKKYGSKCLELSNSSRNAIKNFCLNVTRARADVRARAAREKMREVIMHNFDL